MLSPDKQEHKHMHARSLGLVKRKGRVAAVSKWKACRRAPFGTHDRRLANQIEG